MENYLVTCRDGQGLEVCADSYEKVKIGNELHVVFLESDDVIVEQMLASEVAKVVKQ